MSAQVRPASDGEGQGGDQQAIARVHAQVAPTVQVAFRLFGNFALRRMDKHPALSTKLLRAGSPVVPVAYLSQTYLAVTAAVLFGLVPIFLVLLTGAVPEPRVLLAFVLLPAILAAMTYSYRALRPDMVISAKKRDLEANLPYALNFMAALASAGVVPRQVFQVLGVQQVYGECAAQAALVARDTGLFNKDLLLAMQDAARRSPSQQWEEFLQGAVNTVTSGGELKQYLLGKSEQFSRENRRKQKGFLESLGVMAESYVVVAAAAPLFLIVIISVMLLLQGGSSPILFLNLIVLVALPVIHASFTYILRGLRPD
jgi:flagellar protein FlaJ